MIPTAGLVPAAVLIPTVVNPSVVSPSVARVLPGDAPLDPDADQARDWVLRELSDPAYAAAQPTWWDLLTRSVWDWLQSLTVPGGSGVPTLAIAVLGGLVAAAIVVALLVFGVPRLNRRSTRTGALFGEDDTRDARALRRASERAAAEGRWTDATADAFRAVARGLAERTLVSTMPGTTAHAFGREAGAVFPDEAAALSRAADSFDAVRYLGESGSRETYEQIAALDGRLQAMRVAEMPSR